MTDVRGLNKSFFNSKEGVFETIQLVLSLMILILCLSSSFWSVEGANAMNAVLVFSLLCFLIRILSWIVYYYQLNNASTIELKLWHTFETYFGILGGSLMFINMCISADMANHFKHYEQLPANFHGLLTSCAVFSAPVTLVFFAYSLLLTQENKVTSSAINVPVSTYVKTYVQSPMYIGVTVLQGSIMSANCDAIVNSTQYFDMSAEIGKLLVAKGGQSIADDCANNPLYRSASLRITNAGTLSYKYIFHLHVTSDVTWLENTLREMLKEAEERGVRSLAMPPVGTGGIGLQAQEAATCIRKAIIRFEHTIPNYLQSISIYVFQQAMVATFKQEFPPSRNHVFGSGLPSHWESMEGQLKRVNLLKTSQEYQHVLALFNNTLRKNVSKIERIQNPTLYKQYQAQKVKVTDVIAGCRSIITRELFHGTDASKCDSICNQGFDKGHSGVNGTVHGKGVYFATTAKHSNSYAKGNPKHMFLAEVITGEYCRGNSSMNVAPNQPNGSPYDSVVDNMANPSMFVVFKDTSVYPAYLVIYN